MQNVASQIVEIIGTEIGAPADGRIEDNLESDQDVFQAGIDVKTCKSAKIRIVFCFQGGKPLSDGCDTTSIADR